MDAYIIFSSTVEHDMAIDGVLHNLVMSDTWKLVVGVSGSNSSAVSASCRATTIRQNVDKMSTGCGSGELIRDTNVRRVPLAWYFRQGDLGFVACA